LSYVCPKNFRKPGRSQLYPKFISKHWVTLSFVKTKISNFGVKPKTSLKPKLSRKIKWR